MLRGKLDVVEKDGVHMLRSSEDAMFLVRVPEKIPNRFALEFDIVPKLSGWANTTELSFEGTREVSHSEDSAHVMWSNNRISVIGGGQAYAGGQIDMPEDLKEEVIGNLTKIRAEFDGASLTIQTNGRKVFESKTAKFNRGRILRVHLGGTDEDENAVYLASMRMVALDGGSGNTAQQQSGLATTRATGSQSSRGGPGLNEVRGTSTDTTSTDTTSPDTDSADTAASQAITGITVTVDAVGMATVTWNPLTVAATYQVLRWNAGDSSCCNNMSPPGAPLQNAVWQDGVLPVAGTYAYRVIAKTAEGLIAGETQIRFLGARIPREVATTSIPTVDVPSIAPGPVTTPSSTYVTPGRIAAIAPPSADTTGDSGPIKFGAPAPSDLPTLEESVPSDSTTAIPSVTVPTIAPGPVTTASTGYITPGKLAAIAPPPADTTGDSGPIKFGAPAPSDLPTLEESVPADSTTAIPSVTVPTIAPGPVTTASSGYMTPGRLAILSPGSGETTGDGGVAVEPAGTVVTGEPAPYSSGPRSVSVMTTEPAPGDTDTGGGTGGTSKGGDDASGGGGAGPGDEMQDSSQSSGGGGMPASGRYRVMIAGFAVAKAQNDDLLNIDGIGNEVFAAAAVVNWNRSTSQLTNFSTVQTLDYGDVGTGGRFGDRIKAGTGSMNGGIVAGNRVPADYDVAGGGLPAPASDRFPLLVWEGTLTAGVESIVVSPSIWEHDSARVQFDIYKGNWSKASPSALMSSSVIANKSSSSSLESVVAPISTSVALAPPAPTFTGSPADGYKIAGLTFGPGADRPIGMGLPVIAVLTYQDRFIVVTQENAGSLAVGSGVTLALPYAEPMDPFLGALYTLYVRVERIQ